MGYVPLFDVGPEERPERRPSVLRPLIVIAVIVLSAGLGIFMFSRPVSRSFTMSATCEGMHFPGEVAFDFDDSLSGVHLRGFEGRIERINDLSFEPSPQPKLHWAQPLALAFAVDKDDPSGALPSIRITPQPRRGLQVFSTAGPIDIYSEVDGTASVLRLQSSGASKGEMAMQAESFQIEATHVLTPGAPKEFTDAVTPEDIRFTSLNRDILVDLRFSSPISAANDQPAIATFSFVNVSKAINLIHPTSSALNRQGYFTFSKCLNVGLNVDGTDVPELAKGSPSDLSLDASALTLNRFALTPIQEEQGLFAALSLTVSGKAKSIAQSGREFVPTRLQQILDSPPYQKGLFGMAVIFCIFAGGIFLKRALEVLSSAWIPDIKDNNDKR